MQLRRVDNTPITTDLYGNALLFQIKAPFIRDESESNSYSDLHGLRHQMHGIWVWIIRVRIRVQIRNRVQLEVKVEIGDAADCVQIWIRARIRVWVQISDSKPRSWVRFGIWVRTWVRSGP